MRSSTLSLFHSSTLPLFHSFTLKLFSVPSVVIPLPLPLPPRRPLLPPQRPQKFPHPQRINHILLLQPPSPRHHHPVPYKTQIPRTVRIRRNHHLHALLLAHSQIHILQIQPVRVRIALH